MKKSLGAKNCLYPLPTVLVGANVQGKPNYLAIAHVGITEITSVSVSLNKVHYTNAGIKENQTFSINMPSTDMVQVVDYCGLISGKNVDKAALFETFYGTLRTAPMIQECAVNMECELIQVVDFPQHEVFMGKIADTYCEERYLTDGKVDLAKVQPILFSMLDVHYWKLGEPFARAWSIGKEFKSIRS
jgi:flavin reductase (DIM6/NTAB) family NADH-FMN oxidoreductase RutF